MALRDDVIAERSSVFLDCEEFASLREFRISDGGEGELVFRCRCQWDEDILNRHPLASNLGVYLGDAMVLIPQEHFRRRPRPTQVFSTRRLTDDFGCPLYEAPRQFQILHCAEDAGFYQLTLTAVEGP